MATDVRTEAMSFPYPLGKLLPGGTTASIPLTTNIRPTRVDNLGVTRADVNFAAIRVRAHTSNGSALIYICNSAAAPDTTNYLNVIDVLAAGVEWVRTKPPTSNNCDITPIYIGASNGTAFATGSIDQI